MGDLKAKVSPPQFTLWRELMYSFGADPQIAVQEPLEQDGEWFIDIVVFNPDRAPSVAAVLKELYNFGGIIVHVRVISDQGVHPLQAPQPGLSVAQMVENALFANPYFYRVVPIDVEGPLAGELAVIFYPEVIQFWNDNLADPFGYMHFVAQDVFALVMRDTYPDGTKLVFTTISGPRFL